MRKHLLTALIVSSLVVAGCGKSNSTTDATISQPTGSIDSSVGDDSLSQLTTTTCLSGKPRLGMELSVVSSLAPLTAIIGELVSGTKIKVTGIIPESVDSHKYEPVTSDAKVLAGADLVFVNGLSLDDRVRNLARENAKPGSLLCEVGSAVLPRSSWMFDSVFKQETETPNPHVWLSPAYMLTYVTMVRDAITTIVPDAIPIIDRNYVRLSTQVNQLDEAMKSDVQSLPDRQKVLVTFHPSFPYFAAKYGLEIGGIVQTDLFDDPFASQLVDLADELKTRGIRSVFGSVEFPSGAVAELGKAVGADYSLSLRDDDLPGKPGDATHTWAELMRYDMSTIIKGLGGTPNAVDAVDTRWPDRKDTAVYPQ